MRLGLAARQEGGARATGDRRRVRRSSEMHGCRHDGCGSGSDLGPDRVPGIGSVRARALDHSQCRPLSVWGQASASTRVRVTFPHRCSETGMGAAPFSSVVGRTVVFAHDKAPIGPGARLRRKAVPRLETYTTSCGFAQDMVRARQAAVRWVVTAGLPRACPPGEHAATVCRSFALRRLCSARDRPTASCGNLKHTPSTTVPRPTHRKRTMNALAADRQAGRARAAIAVFRCAGRAKDSVSRPCYHISLFGRLCRLDACDPSESPSDQPAPRRAGEPTG
jgi:hypothetical protein